MAIFTKNWIPLIQKKKKKNLAIITLSYTNLSTRYMWAGNEHFH